MTQIIWLAIIIELNHAFNIFFLNNSKIIHDTNTENKYATWNLCPKR